jgi:imidazolonepropionase-like amidohydrolase
MQRLVVLARTIVDGTGARPVEHAALLLEGERILACGRAADIGVPDGAAVVDGGGATLIPGLIDAHVHLAYSGIPNRAAFRAEHVEMSYAAISLRAAAYAQQALSYGFTALRDMHAPGGTIIDLREAIERGDVEGPRIKACGRGLSVTGGHMDQPGWADHAFFRDMTHPCDGPDSFRRGVREEVKRGADFIKLNTDAAAYGGPGRWCRPEMAPDEIRAACEEAHRQGLRVASHTAGEQALAEAILNGVDCVEHAHFTDDRTVALMAERGTWFVPTLLINERNFEIDRATQGASATHWRWLDASREAKWRTLERARRAGVRICSGSDAGFMIPHASMGWREIALLEQGGLTAMEALVAATATNADLLGIEAGRLAPGRFADFVLVAGDPLADLSVLRDRTRLTVFKSGRAVGLPTADAKAA